MTPGVETYRALAGWIKQAAGLGELCAQGESACSSVELPIELAEAGLACRRNDSGPAILALRASCSEVQVSAARAEALTLLQRGRELGARCLNVALPFARLGAECAGFDRYRASLNFCYDLLAASYSEAEAVGVDLAVEVPAAEALHSPVELAELLDAVPSSAVGVCLEDARFARSDALPDWLATLSRRVFSLRLTERTGSGWESDPENKHLIHLRQVLDHIDYQGLIITPTEAVAALETVLLPTRGD